MWVSLTVVVAAVLLLAVVVVRLVAGWALLLDWAVAVLALIALTFGILQIVIARRARD